MKKQRRKVQYYNVDLNNVNNLIDTANELNINIDRFEGSLLDNYIIYNNDRIKLGKATREYILIVERYLNSWSSCYDVIMTDSEKQIGKYIELFNPEN